MRKEALNQLGFWDAKEREGALSLVEAVARKEDCQGRLPKMGFDRRSIFKEASWRQRENWLKEGDRNIKFFHKMANIRC